MTSTTLVHPATGEILDLAAPAWELGRTIDEIRDIESRLREIKAEINAEFHRRMDRDRSWTIHTPDFDLVGRSDQPERVWDIEQLQALLATLENEGVISREAALAAVQPRIEYKVLHRGIEALRKNPALREQIDACFTEQPPANRRVSVKRTS